jgi:Na+/H+-dicarboxylate symporter
MKKKIIIPLICISLLALVFHAHLPLYFKAAMLSLSLSVKAVLLFSLPVLIAVLLFKTTSQLTRGASWLIAAIVFFVVASNSVSTLLGYATGSLLFVLPIDVAMPALSCSLEPLFELTLPCWMKSSTALASGAVAGLIISYSRGSWVQVCKKSADAIASFLLKAFVGIVPVFIFGFLLKLAHEGQLTALLGSFAKIFAFIAAIQLVYIALFYLSLYRFNVRAAWSSIRPILPAAFVGFSAMSSAAAMPLTIKGVQKSALNKDIGSSCIPATVSIHLIGDCLAIPLLAFAIIKSAGMAMPSLTDYLLFSALFVLAKFSVAAIPGGGILVMLPILEKQLSMTAPMLSLITALYILFDPIITFTNVLGNGAFALAIDKIMQKKLAKAPTTLKP